MLDTAEAMPVEVAGASDNDKLHDVLAMNGNILNQHVNKIVALRKHD
jgi:hypothetical protein